MCKEKRQSAYRAQRNAAEKIRPDHFAKHEASGQTRAVEKKACVNEQDIGARYGDHQPQALDHKLDTGNLPDIESVGEYTPDERRAELCERDRAHEGCGDQRRVADVGDVRKNMQIETGNTNAGDAEGDYQ